MKNTAHIGRGFLQNFNYSLSYLKSSLVLSTLRFFIPALVCGCHEIEVAHEDIEVRSVASVQSGHPVRDLDIFMFEDDEMRILDSYQRTDDIQGWEVTTASRKGERLAFVVANGQWKKEDWMMVNSYDALMKYRADLEHERSDYPVMSGMCHLYADGIRTVWIELSCLCAEIVLKSVNCDFSDKSYEDKGVSEMKAYLINVNAQSPLTSNGSMMPERIINMGGLNNKDMKGMDEPELLYHHIGGLVSGEYKELDFRFRCYPNNCLEESPGSPFTRLVLEGVIDGKTYYWPIDIGRGGNASGNEDGISRNRRYIYDVTITGKGGESPDVPVGSKVCVSKLEISEWEEKKEYVIGF